MKSFFIQGIHALLYSNIFIAICAVAFFKRGLLLYDIPIDSWLLSAFIFSSTTFTYLFIRLAAVKRIEQYKPEQRWNFFLGSFTPLLLLAIASALASAILFFYLPLQIRLIFIIPGVISVLYGLPVIKRKGRWWKLRDFGISKIFLIAFVWTFTGSILPAFVTEGIAVNILLSVADFFFIFAITIPFDVKDLEVDAMHKVKTIPAIIGVEQSYSLSFFLLFIAGGLYAFALHTELLPPITISIVLTGLIIYATRFSKKNTDYFGWIDGTILLQYILLLTYLLAK